MLTNSLRRATSGIVDYFGDMFGGRVCIHLLRICDHTHDSIDEVVVGVMFPTSKERVKKSVLIPPGDTVFMPIPNWIAPMRFVLTMRRICWSVRPSSGPASPYPALLKTTSTPPIAIAFATEFTGPDEASDF